MAALPSSAARKTIHNSFTRSQEALNKSHEHDRALRTAPATPLVSSQSTNKVSPENRESAAQTLLCATDLNSCVWCRLRLLWPTSVDLRLRYLALVWQLDRFLSHKQGERPPPRARPPGRAIVARCPPPSVPPTATDAWSSMPPRLLNNQVSVRSAHSFSEALW